jgi:uncharacterized protein YraI
MMDDTHTVALEHIQRVAQYAINQPGNAAGKLQSVLNAISTPTTRVKVTPTWLNVRSGPGKEYTAVGAVKQGDIVEIIKQENNWGRMPGPTERWISLRFTTPV